MFSAPQQDMLAKGHINRSIIKKMLKMKYCNYQYETMFRLLHPTLSTMTIPSGYDQGRISFGLFGEPKWLTKVPSLE